MNQANPPGFEDEYKREIKIPTHPDSPTTTQYITYPVDIGWLLVIDHTFYMQQLQWVTAWIFTLTNFQWKTKTFLQSLATAKIRSYRQRTDDGLAHVRDFVIHTDHEYSTWWQQHQWLASATTQLENVLRLLQSYNANIRAQLHHTE